MRWRLQTRYEGQFTHAVLPHGFGLLQSGRRHIDWVGVGYEGRDDLTMEVHRLNDGNFMVTAGVGDAQTFCSSFDEAVAFACMFFVPGFADHATAMADVLSAVHGEMRS